MQDKPGQSVPRIRLNLFLTFFRIGLFTFGGGYAMLPLIEREISENKKWVETDELIDMIALAQSMPGPVAVNASIFIGRHLAGTTGAVSAMLGCTLPSVMVILAVAIGTTDIQENRFVQQFFTGVLAAVTALILLTATKMARRVVHDKLTAGLAITSAILVAFFHIHALLIIICGAAIGLALYWLNPGRVRRVTGYDRKTRTWPAAKNQESPPAHRGPDQSTSPPAGTEDAVDPDQSENAETPDDRGKGAGSC